jgi:hypothetical protein
MYYVVYDNFLNPEEFGIIKRYLGPGGGFPWLLSARINTHDTSNDAMYFATLVHHSYHDGWIGGIERSPFELITSKIHMEAIYRIKSNLYFPSKTGKVEHHAPHCDSDFKHQGALFYLTTCDAPTTMADGTQIQAIENRLLLFDAATMHSSSSPTNVPFRITINFNYFGAGLKKSIIDDMLNPIPIVSCNPEKLGDFFIKK